ncbi:MAG: twin transmembrane helix small protein [Alphaproteobacteria bacterium]
MIEILVAIALGATLTVLFVGIFAMLRGGEFNRKYGNKLMRTRVAMQALAIALLFILFLINRG